MQAQWMKPPDVNRVVIPSTIVPGPAFSLQEENLRLPYVRFIPSLRTN